MQKVKDLKSLEKFSKLYKDYKILSFDSGNIKKEDILLRTSSAARAFSSILPIKIRAFTNT